MFYFKIFYVLLVLLLLITATLGRALRSDELIEDDDTKLSSSEEKNSQTKFLNALYGNGNAQDDDSSAYDSLEERKFHARSLVKPSRLSHTLSAKTRQALIDILEKALAEGWRPSNSHHNSATRFGAHGR
ncbi:unnamed protein product [Adineta steineri]|uniref:Uncharacterized protein n=1 Tax=Adineta steineri TaxID=433720 RepID=A0A818M0V4_9BILA|nr:unnamed protein product [Adineta steineri]CAF3587472.1 unnamed protein product [Adineta steineri]